VWIDSRRRDLDRLDKKVQTRDQGIQDMAMTLTVWQAIKDRYTDLVRVWDSGRVTPTDLKKIAVMTWANLNDMLTPGTTLTSGGGLSVSLPEACRMLEALVAQLSSRYQLAPVSTETSARIAALVAQVERIKDQTKLEPAQFQQTDAVAALEFGVKDLNEKANRGADIGGILAPLEVRAALMERDLIVGHAERAMLSQKVNAIKARRTALIARETAITALVEKTQASVDPAPKYAVPHVEALGEIPSTAPELDEYIARLEKVNAALDIVQKANQKALADLKALTTRFESAEAIKDPSDPLAASLSSQIRALLEQTPAPLSVIDPLIAAYEASGVSS